MSNAIFRNWFLALPLILALALLSGCVPGSTCISGDCQNGQGTMSMLGGYRYTGEWRNGEANGQGTFIYRDGTRFDGQFDGGRRIGPGVLTRTNGQVVRGVWRDVKTVGWQTIEEFSAAPPVQDSTLADGSQAANGRARPPAERPAAERPPTDAGRCAQGDCVNGQGTFIWPTGQKYVGGFRDGKRHGQGSVTSSNGLYGHNYTGELRDDKANGQGTQTWPNGNKYVGEFRDDMPNGQGTFTRPDGHRYVGEYKDGKANGQGIVTSLNGHSYVGELKDNKADGQGTVIYSNGQKYSGDFRDDKRAGLGMQTTPGQPTQWGVWANDLLVQALSEQEFAARRANADGQASPSLALAGNMTPAKAEHPKAVQSISQSAAPGPKQRRVALVIGNGSYTTAPLKNPVNDARDMAAALKALGFEVILRENASLAQMEGAVEEFWVQLKKGGAGLFYFAGHGLQVHGKNYLVPVDAKLSAEQDARYKCMDAGLVLGRMENAGNDLNLVILDACRNNPFARSWRSAEQGLAKMDAPRGSIIAYATAPDSVAADGAGRNGIYTEKLLRAIRAPGQPVELVFKRVRDEVMRATGDKQVPWESTSLRGDFYFTNP
ncbi:MAG: caspase family protein [Proteobacteria bacterium]|nr:caspase family protein [Pseudomonadota bacterium]MBU1596157.1 caspase family protein [Pseudomonadota bacterium]